MDNRIVMISIAAVIGIIVLGSVLMPILDDATTTEDKFTNEGTWRMKEIKNGDSWTRTTSEGWSYGDTLIALPTGQSGTNVMLGEDWCIRYIGHLRSTASVNKSTNLNNAIVTAGEELIVASKTDSTWTANLNYPGYGADPNGNYTLTKYDSAAYVNGDTQIYGTGISTIQDTQVFVHVVGSVDNGATFTISQSAGEAPISDVVITNPSVNYTEIDDHKDLYRVSSITCDVSYNTTIDDVSTPQTGTITFSSYVVPYEVTAERSVHFNAGQNAIFAAIPVMIILAVLLGVVALVIRSRMD